MWINTINFGVGIILGVLAVFFYNISYFWYYCVFAPLCISIYIIINFKYTQMKNTKRENDGITK